MKANELIAFFVTQYESDPRCKGRYMVSSVEAGMAKNFVKYYNDAQLEAMVPAYFEFRESLFPPVEDEGYTLSHLIRKREALKSSLKNQGRWPEEEE